MSDTNASNPILAACVAGDLDGLRSLLGEHRVSDQSSMPSLDTMAETGALHAQIPIVSYALSNGARLDSVLTKAVVKSGSLSLLQHLLAHHNLGINHELGYVSSVLVYATSLNYPESYIRFCFSQGADPVNQHSSTARPMMDTWRGIEVAIMCSTAGVVGSYLENGAQVRGTEGLRLAAAKGCAGVLKMLLRFEHRVDVVNEVVVDELTTTREEEGGVGTALHAAAGAGHEDVVRVLLERGADVGIRNTKGQTALETAEMSRHDNVVALLRDR